MKILSIKPKMILIQIVSVSKYPRGKPHGIYLFIFRLHGLCPEGVATRADGDLRGANVSSP